jgi:hypothetical protein
MSRLTGRPRQIAWLLALLVLAGAGCRREVPVEPAPPEEPSSPGPPLAGLVHTLSGRPVLLSTLLEPDVSYREETKRPVLEVDQPEYLVLVVTHADCSATKRFLDNLELAAAGLRDLHGRAAVLLREKDSGDPARWRALEKKGFPVLYDADCYRTYVRDRTPTILVFDRHGNNLFWCDGFMEPDRLVERLLARDFTNVRGEDGCPP